MSRRRNVRDVHRLGDPTLTMIVPWATPPRSLIMI